MEERVELLEKRVRRLSELIVFMVKVIDFPQPALDKLNEITERWDEEDEEDNTGDTE